MTRVLFITNGHGEMAIADRIAADVAALAPNVQIDHLALVGSGRSEFMRDIGPSRAMPSGGLIAMGNVTNIVRDVRGGLLGLTLAQRRFLKDARGTYARVVAVGDIFALLMALSARTPTTYVGTAKSVTVAPYGAFERRVLRRANPIFVRDEATAKALRDEHVDALAPGNVMVDLYARDVDERSGHLSEGFVPSLAVFPGSRENAYDDAAFILDVVRACAATHPTLGAMVSLAPQLDAALFAKTFVERGWLVDASSDDLAPFTLREGERTIARAWRGTIGPLIGQAQLVLGQAGTANEAAAAAGVPVVAFERAHDRKTAWYRMRQQGLLGDALMVTSGDVEGAARDVSALLADSVRRVRMGTIGRERMGAPGGARTIARSIAEAVA